MNDCCWLPFGNKGKLQTEIQDRKQGITKVHKLFFYCSLGNICRKYIAHERSHEIGDIVFVYNEINWAYGIE